MCDANKIFFKDLLNLLYGDTLEKFVIVLLAKYYSYSQMFDALKITLDILSNKSIHFLISILY